MKYTVLEMVQSLLASMDSDEVNSITDTVEANDLALMLRDVFYEIAVELNLPEHETTFELNASLDVSKPVLMTVPTNVVRLDWIKYDNKLSTETHKNFLDVEYVCFRDFIERQQGLRERTTDVASMSVTENGEVFEVLYETEAFPTFYTTIGENQLVFNSYFNDVDSTLQKSKTLCHGRILPTFTVQDNFVPALDATQFPYFLNKAKSRAFVEKKQTQNGNAERSERQQKIVVQKRKYSHKVHEPRFNANIARYGRK